VRDFPVGEGDDETPDDRKFGCFVGDGDVHRDEESFGGSGMNVFRISGQHIYVKSDGDAKEEGECTVREVIEKILSLCEHITLPIRGSTRRIVPAFGNETRKRKHHRN
jgi:hypothetical protein